MDLTAAQKQKLFELQKDHKTAVDKLPAPPPVRHPESLPPVSIRFMEREDLGVVVACERASHEDFGVVPLAYNERSITLHFS